MKEQPFILNIESATGVCSVCVSKGLEVVNVQAAEEHFQHAKVLTDLMDRCLTAAGVKLRELDAIAVSSGPGSYTSLRVGISTAKGICYALNKPLISVNTLQSLALAAKIETEGRADYYCPMIDARRMEVYCNVFDGEGIAQGKPISKVIEAGVFDDFLTAGKRMVFCGNGAAKCETILQGAQVSFHPSECSAIYLPSLSLRQYRAQNFEDVAYFKPLYLKPPNITIPKHKNLLKPRKNQ